MKNKLVLAALILTTLTYWVYQSKSGPPTVDEIKFDPRRFVLSDYPDKVRLHTRLTTLFPRGTQQYEIRDFFDNAGIARMHSQDEDCLTYDIYAHAFYSFDEENRTLRSIAVRTEQGKWPEPVQESCEQLKLESSSGTLTPDAQSQEPIVLPLKSLDE